jgi:hypothetical protein
MWFSLSFPGPFDPPFDKLTVLSKVEGLTALSTVEGLTGESSVVKYCMDSAIESLSDRKK